MKPYKHILLCSGIWDKLPYQMYPSLEELVNDFADKKSFFPNGATIFDMSRPHTEQFSGMISHKANLISWGKPTHRFKIDNKKVYLRLTPWVSEKLSTPLKKLASF